MADRSIAAGKNRSSVVRMVRSDGWTKARRKAFIDELAACCNVRHAAQVAGVSSHNAYTLRKRDPDFAALWDQAIAIGYDQLEAALLNRALQAVNDFEITVPDAPVIVDPGDAPLVSPPGTGIKPAIRTIDVHLALALLNRRRSIAEGRGRRPAPTTGTTAAETTALLTKRLDALAKRMRDKYAPQH